MVTAARVRVVRPSRFLAICYYGVVVGLLIAALFLWRPLTFQRLYARARLAIAGAHQGMAQAGSYRIHYYVAGSGRPIVLLHGLGGDALFWADYVPHLAQQGRVYAIDLLGFGSSDRPDVDYRATTQAQVVHDFLDSQNIQQADLLGISMGGFVALHVARQWPHRVRRLVVADSAGIIFDPNAPQPPFPQDEQRFRRFMTPKRSSMPPFVVRDMLRRMRAQQRIIDRALQNRSSGKDYLDGQLQAVNMPVLLVWGEHDMLTPLSWGTALHQQIPQSVLVVLQGCGHIALYDCRQQAFPEIQGFLSSPKPETGGVRTVPPR